MDPSLAAALWPGREAMGLHDGPFGQIEVVGVVEPLRLNGPARPLTPTLIRPVSREETQARIPFDTLHVRIHDPSPAVLRRVREVAREVLKDLPFSFDSLEVLRDQALAQPRKLLFLSTTLGFLALALSLTGLYGLAAHLAEIRHRELGIRVALGAGPGRILGVLARGSLLPVIPGLAGGCALSLAASRLLVAQNEGLVGLDPPLLAWACLALLSSAALACLFPALHAACMNPAEALRRD